MNRKNLKIHMYRFAVVIAGLLLSSTFVFAANPPNGGFENDLDGWSLHFGQAQISSDSHTGSRACRLDCQPTEDQALLNSSSFPVVPGRTYTLKSYVKMLSTSGNYMVAIAWLDSQNKTIYHDNAWAGTDNPASYSLHTGEFTAPAGTVRSVIMLGASPGSTILFDDVELTSDLVLDNGVLTVRMDIDFFGGAITYLSLAGQDRNIINTYDRGREIQQSYYAGQSLDRAAQGQHPRWSPWPWNPIQVGDAYGHSSQVTEANIVDDVAYTKTTPLLWDMNNASAQCYFEQWTTLIDNTIHVRNKITCYRTDSIWTQVVPRHQELPAVYTIADLSNLYTYVGSNPWQQQQLTRIRNNGPPWEYWTSHENWAATVDSNNWGVGVYNSNATLFVGGLFGSPSGSTSDPSTSYISPLRTESFDKNTIYEYEYDLIVGDLAQIRQLVYMKHFGAVTIQVPPPRRDEPEY